MAVTSHAYPVTIQKINSNPTAIDLSVTTAGSFLVGLCTGDASAWTATQEAYAFVSDVTGAYTEVVTGGYARVDISSGVTISRSGNVVKWTCTSPISFGSSITLTARSMFVFTKLTGSADASWPVIAIVDFGQNVISTSGAWTYTVDGVNGLVSWTET
jgi:hypothetical protein